MVLGPSDGIKVDGNELKGAAQQDKNVKNRVDPADLAAHTVTDGTHSEGNAALEKKGESLLPQRKVICYPHKRQ